MDSQNNTVDEETNMVSEKAAAHIVPYCQAATSTIVRVNQNKVLGSQVQEELEINMLVRKHQDANDRIAALLKRIETSSAASKTLESRRSTFAQHQPQTRMRVTRTGELMKLVKNEVETLKRDASEAAEKVGVVARELGNFRSLTTTTEENKKRFIELARRTEKGLQELKNQKVEIEDDNLVGRNADLERAIKSKLEVLEEKRRRIPKVSRLTGEKIGRLEAICAESAELEEARRRLEGSRRDLEERRLEAKQEIEILEGRIEELSAKKTASEQDEARSRSSNNELEAKMEVAREEIRNRERELVAVTVGLEAEQRKVEERKEKLRIELESDRDTFAAEGENLRKVREENARLKQVRTERCATLLRVKTELDECRSFVSDAETRVAERRERLEALRAKAPPLDLLLDDLKSRLADFDESVAESTRKLDSFPSESARRTEEARKRLEEVDEKLSKRLELLRASSEILQDRLRTVSEEWELVRVENELLDEQLRTENVNLERKLDSLAALQKEVADLRDTHRPLADGRRSPGILKHGKSPKKQPVTSPKKVTFEGLSSTQSTNETVESEDSRTRGLFADWTLGIMPQPKKPAKKIFDF
ncbi:rho-associated protein kinase 1-like [Cylas formicarius]|uniref:rho-associated protein kinase 1-like n=1 Tax=Cylas formicarius TaxID=197179 RepID=UPI002958CA9B|nr:rho-associated protein kinase 1-like [Cylas formicarius]